jgi:hypothetical protein
MTLTREARAALDGIDDLDWSAHRHPYGSAADVPDHLRNLLEAPDTDPASEAGLFFATYFVCQGVHYEDAAVPGIPFLLRLLAAPGVSARSYVLSSLVAMLRISIDDDNTEVGPVLKQACLEAFAGETRTIVRAVRLLERAGWDDAMQALVVAFADAIERTVPTGRPALIDGTLARVRATGPSPQARLDAWAGGAPGDAVDRLLQIEQALTGEWSPSEGDDEEDEEGEPEDGSDAEAPFGAWENVVAWARDTYDVTSEPDDILALTVSWSGTERTQGLRIKRFEHDDEDWLALMSTVCRAQQMNAADALAKNVELAFATLALDDGFVILVYSVPIAGLAPRRLRRLVHDLASDADDLEEAHTGGADEF